MKSSLARIICLALAILMTISLFTACGEDEKTTTATDVSGSNEPVDGLTSDVSVPEDVIVAPDADDPYTINGELVIVVPGENDTNVMEVAENTTYAAFKECV